MSPKMECYSKWNVTHNGMSLRMECHSNGMSLKMKYSIKMECQSKWNVTQN